MKLMYDNTDVSFEQELSEGAEKKYRIKGIFSSPEKQNKNGRIYPMQIWEREVQKYQDILKSGHPNCLMELDHLLPTDSFAPRFPSEHLKMSL